MATKRSIEAKRQIAGRILHIGMADGQPKAQLANGESRYVSVEDYNDLLKDAKRLAGSALSSKQEKPGLMKRLGRAIAGE